MEGIAPPVNPLAGVPLPEGLHTARAVTMGPENQPPPKWRCTRCGAETDMETLPESWVDAPAWWDGEHHLAPNDAPRGPTHICENGVWNAVYSKAERITAPQGQKE